MSKCEKYRELMNLALDDAITEYEQKRLNDHLASCPECRLVNEALRSISEAISEDMVEPPERLVKNVMREITAHRSLGWKSLTAIAACFVLIAAAVGVGFAQHRGTGGEEESISAYAQVSDEGAAADEAYDAGELSAGAGEREHGLRSPHAEPEEPLQGVESEEFEPVTTDTTEAEKSSSSAENTQREQPDAPEETIDGSVTLMDVPTDVFKDMVSAAVYFSGSVDGTEPDVTLTEPEELELLAELLTYEEAAGIPVPESEALFTVIAVNSSGEETEIRVWRSDSELLMEFNGELYTVSGFLEDILSLIG